MEALGEGLTSRTIPETTRRDEVGDMARMVEIFRQNAVEQGRLTSARDEHQGSQLRRATAIESSDRFVPRRNG